MTLVYAIVATILAGAFIIAAMLYGNRQEKLGNTGEKVTDRIGALMLIGALLGVFAFVCFVTLIAQR